MNTTGRLIIRRACPRSDPVPAVACAVPNAPASRVATCRAMSAGDSGHYSTCGGWGNRRSSHSTIGLPCFTIDLMSRLPFITFEGSEGCGKSTQVKKLATRFQQMGVPCLVTREPGGTPIGETIRELLQFAPHNAGMTPETELLLFEASRSQLVRETIKPALKGGVCVIADRFFDSTTVYQGAARKLDRQIVEFYERVREAYRELAAREPNRIALIDGSRDADRIEKEIWEIVSSRFPRLASQAKSKI